MKTQHADIKTYETKDGSLIRELLHPSKDKIRNQSLAEATIPANTKTLLHLHRHSEEIYHITSGRGLMTLAEKSFEVAPGDSICIPPGTPHCIKNRNNSPLVILCCCAPAYSHGDTELLEAIEE